MIIWDLIDPWPFVELPATSMSIWIRVIDPLLTIYTLAWTKMAFAEVENYYGNAPVFNINIPTYLLLSTCCTSEMIIDLVSGRVPLYRRGLCNLLLGHVITVISSCVNILICLCRDAWSSLGDMPKEEAMSGYVDEMKLVIIQLSMVHLSSNKPGNTLCSVTCYWTSYNVTMHVSRAAPS